MVNTEIRLIIFFAAKDAEALYSQQKQDRELTVAQIMSSLLPNSDLNWRKQGKPLDHEWYDLMEDLKVWPKSKQQQHVIILILLSKHMEHTTPKVNPKVIYGLWVIIIYQYRFILSKNYHSGEWYW